MAFLKVSSVCKQKENEGDFILNDITFVQSKLQKIAIVGETGSGKSTLLKIIAGLIQQDKGEVWLENEPVDGPSRKLVPGHPSIAYLSQYFELPKFLRVEQILSYANTLAEAEAIALYELCEINHLVKRKTDQLSGGEKQRIAMARLLIGSPRLLLLDEPFSHLDRVHKNTLKSVIERIGKKLQITCILVSHDPEDTLSWADKILVMRAGQIVQSGTAEKIYREPLNEYVAGLLGKYNLLSPELSGILRSETIGKTIFRPEDFKLATKGKKKSRGTVSQVKFFGSHLEAEIKIAGTAISVRTDDHDLSEGEEVYISLRNSTGTK